MKFVLNEPPAWTQRTVDIVMQKKDNRDEMVEVFHGDDGDKVAEITIEQKTRNIIVKGVGSAKLVFADDSGNPLTVGGPTAGSRVRQPGEMDKGPFKRNWSIEDAFSVDEEGNEQLTGGKTFKVWLDNGASIELPVMAEPGEFTPIEEPYEIFGQHEMLFAICLSVRLGKNSLLTGPTGIGKTTVYRWLAKKLNYNLLIQPIARGTQDRHLVGEYAPAGPGDFRWMYGPMAKAVIASTTHPTILVLDEINRIGNIAEFSRAYSLLDDTRMLELAEKRMDDGTIEQLKAGELYIGATANPTDDEGAGGADYVGVKELDPAFNSRFPIQPRLEYPIPEIEINALMDRVPELQKNVATKMVEAAKRVRESHEVRFPMSFRELEAWAICCGYYGYKDAAEIAVVQKAPAVFRPDIRNLLTLQGLT